MSKSYKINEIFESVQMEGFHAGQASIFIRFSGCNRKCYFCDTSHKFFKLYLLDEILEEVEKYNAELVTITGGEPFLEGAYDNDLYKGLKKLGKWVQIESNGTLETNADFDWLTVSPKGKKIENIKKVNELKIIIDGKTQIDDIQKYIENVPFATVYLQPLFGNDEAITNAMNIIKRYPDFRLSIQGHKFIGIE